MKAIILAAGRGSRMGSMSEHQPKCLTKINGKSLIDLQLSSLRNSAIEEIAIVGGYKAEMLADKADKQFINPNWETTNMVCSLESAEAWLGSDSCIVSYSDIFYEKKAVELLINSKSDISITYDPNWLQLWRRRFSDPLVDAESFQLDNAENLINIGEKPKNLESIQGQYMGLLKITPHGWHAIKKILIQLGPKKKNLHMTGLLQLLINQGTRVNAIKYEGVWGEIDTESDIKAYL